MNFQVILTPSFDGRVWYEKNPEKKTLTIHGIQGANAEASSFAGEVSYNLTALKYDLEVSSYYIIVTKP